MFANTVGESLPDWKQDEKLYAIEHALDEESVAVTRSWTQCFTQGKPRYFQRMVLAIMALCMLQLSGINLITYYA